MAVANDVKVQPRTTNLSPAKEEKGGVSVQDEDKRKESEGLFTHVHTHFHLSSCHPHPDRLTKPCCYAMGGSSGHTEHMTTVLM